MKNVRTVFAGVTCMALAAVAGAQTSITLWDFNQAGLSTTSPAPGGTGVSYPIEATIRCPGAPTKDKKRRAQ